MKKVAIGLSGGVDSTLAAWQLKELGYEVIGVTMAVWEETEGWQSSGKGGCYGPGEAEDIEAAREAASRLQIPYHVIDLRKEYHSIVLDYFRKTYAAGMTPNPCVVCNQRLKFGLLIEKAREAGIDFDYFATGHYVQVGQYPASGRWAIRRGVDPVKDQSYFLTQLQQDQLSQVIFPLGGEQKQAIKELAMRVGFAEYAQKAESQDFIESDNYDILFDPADSKPGKMVDVNGKVIGNHKGIIHYTIGQRRHLGIAGTPEPYFVLGIDACHNTVTVGPKEYLYHRACIANSINWMAIFPPVEPFKAKAKIRVQHEAADCTIYPIDASSARIEFTDEQLSITPGQQIVFYDQDWVLGGGYIQDRIEDNTK